MASGHHPSYPRVFYTFLRNSLVRDMSFRSNFWIECLASLAWVVMNVAFYLLIFRYTDEIGNGTGWGKYQFFVFLATTMIVNSMVQTFFMPNAEEFSELIRTGGLDFALLKPIDTQFLVSLRKVAWSSMANFGVGLCMLLFSVWKLSQPPHQLIVRPAMFLLYPIYIICGVLILYSLMISLAATSVWLGRNQTLYNFWFYITSFSRYPMEIYRGTFGTPLRNFFTFIIPVFVVINVPARMLARPLYAQDWSLATFAIGATLVSLVLSRMLFQLSLLSYRSASS